MAGTEMPMAHSHIFLGGNHERAERRTWAVIWLCTAMMVAEIVGGALFGSLALIADGVHMSTHAGALLLAAAAYTLARRHASNPNFTFGTGKFGDLAGFSSAIILGMIALGVGYEALERFLHPVAIRFDEAIPIAVLGLAVNIASAWLLAGGHHHGHGHAHDHHHTHTHARSPDHHHHDHGHAPAGHHHRDNNMRAAFVHVLADAAISVLVIAGLLLARAFGWLWMDPLAGLIGACVIANWAYALMRDTAGVLLDRTPDVAIRDGVRARIESDGDRLIDLHLWRLGPGHLGAIVSVVTAKPRGPDYYRAQLRQFPDLSHVTVEVAHLAP